MSGFESPNYTQLPNDLFDTEMVKMGHAELRVVIAVCRYTFGYHRLERRISLTKVCNMTGLSRSSVLSGARKAEEHGYIERLQDGGVTLWVVKVINQPVNLLNQSVNVVNQTGIGSIPPSIKETSKESIKENTVRSLKKKRTGDPLDTLVAEHRSIVDAFLRLWKAPPPQWKEINFWREGAMNLIYVCGDNEPTKILKEIYDDWKKKGMSYTVSSPTSLIKVARSMVAKNRVAKKVYTDPDGNTMEF